MINKILPDYSRKWLLLVVIINTLAYNGARFFTQGRSHTDLSTNFDYKIPALNWTIVIYFGCYIFWIVNYILATRENKDKAMQSGGYIR